MSRCLSFVVTSVAVLVSGCTADDERARVVGQLTSDRIELSVEFAEPIVDILVAEGDPIVAGQVLLQQDDRRARARLAEQDAVVSQAQARLDELIRGPRSELIAAARANAAGAADELAFRQSDYDRTERIHGQNLASAEQLDRARAAVDAARANNELRRAQLQELLSGTTVEELAQAEQNLLRAQARRDLLAIDVEQLTIRAPVAGIADSRLFEIGERPTAGQPVFIALAGAQPHAHVYLPSELRAKVASGTAATIFVEGRDGSIAGRVRWVASESAFTPYFALTERDRGRLSYEAKIDVVGLQDRLPEGLPVEVEFEF